LISLRHQVFFCTPVPGSVKKMSFRRPRGDDYSASYLRQHVFQKLAQRELSFDMILGRVDGDHNPDAQPLLTDSDNPLPKWQDEDASYHWRCELRF
jgi:hypothetical protein